MCSKGGYNNKIVLPIKIQVRIRRRLAGETEKKDAAGANTGGVLFCAFPESGVFDYLIGLFKRGIQVFGPGSAGLRHIRSSAAAAADKG